MIGSHFIKFSKNVIIFFFLKKNNDKNDKIKVSGRFYKSFKGLRGS